MDNINLTKNIKNIFENMSFSDQYNNDIWIVIVSITLVILISIYFYILNTIKSQKVNWHNKKCNPLFMPFASIIASDSADSSGNFTTKNFEECLNNLNYENSQQIKGPIETMMSILMSIFAFCGQIISQIIGFFSYLFGLIFALITSVLRRLRLLIDAFNQAIAGIMALFQVITEFVTGILYTFMLAVELSKYIFTLFALAFFGMAVAPTIVGTGIMYVLVISAFCLACALGWLNPGLWATWAGLLVTLIILTLLLTFVLMIHGVLGDFAKNILCNLRPALSENCPS